MNTSKSCKDLIDQELENRITEFQIALEQEKNQDGIEIEGDHYENFIEWVYSIALAYEDDPHERAKKLELSYGGPEDYFLFFDDDTIEYHYLDWFDGAVRTLEGDDYDIMAQVRDYLRQQ